MRQIEGGWPAGHLPSFFARDRFYFATGCGQKPFDPQRGSQQGRASGKPPNCGAAKCKFHPSIFLPLPSFFPLSLTEKLSRSKFGFIDPTVWSNFLSFEAFSADNSHMTIYRLTTDPEQQWFLTCKRKAITLANSFCRIVSPESDVVVEEVTTEPPVIGLNGGPIQIKHPLPFIPDRQTQTRWKRPRPCDGKVIPCREIYREAGRGHLFTPAEKRKTYTRSLQYRIQREHYVHLAPLIDLVLLNRTDLPLGRFLQAQKKLKENP